jgi:ribosomal protein S18 acetylase RimI-like enzyme
MTDSSSIALQSLKSNLRTPSLGIPHAIDQSGAQEANDCPCRFLEWDSQFFACRIARVEHTRLTQDLGGQVLAWCSLNQIDCLYLKVDSNDAESVRVAEALRCQLVDLKVAFEQTMTGPPPKPDSMRLWREPDIDELARIAAASHLDTRFYYDGRFPRERCDELYRVWIERSCRGWADAVFVAEHRGRPAGYISCHLSSSEAGSIGLIGVASEARGCGLGKSLVQAALRFFWDNGRRYTTVVTQGRNLASQRLYQRCGFVTQSVALYYHRWFTPSSERSAGVIPEGREKR